MCDELIPLAAEVNGRALAIPAKRETGPAEGVFKPVMGVRMPGGSTAAGRLSFAMAPTELGVFGVVWTEQGIVRTWLHDRTDSRTRQQILRSFPNADEGQPPAGVAAAIADVAALLAGESRALLEADLDMRTIPEFDRRVYELARTIPPGETITYGAISKALGEEPMRARDVGQALARNPFAPIVPCHRVVAANGQLGGYSAPGGAATKRWLLALEGAAIVAPPAQAGLFD